MAGKIIFHTDHSNSNFNFRNLLGFFGEDKSRDSSVTRYTSQNIPIGISDQLNPKAIEKLGIDLTDNLDPKLIPAITSEALRETTQANVSE